MRKEEVKERRSEEREEEKEEGKLNTDMAREPTKLINT